MRFLLTILIYKTIFGPISGGAPSGPLFFFFLIFLLVLFVFFWTFLKIFLIFLRCPSFLFIFSFSFSEIFHFVFCILLCYIYSE